MCPIYACEKYMLFSIFWSWEWYKNSARLFSAYDKTQFEGKATVYSIYKVLLDSALVTLNNL